MWKLYKVQHAIGTFIGVAKSEEHAREHWGTLATIEEITDEKEILEMRLAKPDRVFIAV